MTGDRIPAAVCRTSEVAEAGAFFTADVDGTPVLVSCDQHGKIRALVNICRHQGARIVHERQGVTKSFTCILHGWSYDAEGNMGGGVLAKLAQGNPMLATLRNTNALTPLPCELRHGFVWVMPRAREAIDVAAFLGPLDAELAARGVEHWRVRERSEEQADAEEPTRFVFHDDALSVYSVRRRRAESDFGEVMPGEYALTLERLVVGP